MTNVSFIVNSFFISKILEENERSNRNYKTLVNECPYSVTLVLVMKIKS
jgi:hypothetical protein